MELVSIIIPVYPPHNRKDILETCLKSIENQTYPKEKIELILVGDGCNVTYDLSSQGIKTKIYNFKRHVGVTKARNKAIQLSSGELLAFIDADHIAEEDWLENLVKGFKNENIGGCGGKIIDLKYNILNTKNYDNKTMKYDAIFDLPFISIGNSIFRRRVLEEIGFLDEHLYFGGQSLDLSWRVYLKGYRLEYIPEAVNIHKGIARIKDFFLYGMRTRDLINKYKGVFGSLCPLELTKFPMFIKKSIEKRLFVPNSIVLCGYIFALLKEKFHLVPQLEPIELTDRFLQPVSSIKPLAVTINSKPLIKPNYILWWKTESGLRILNLKNHRRYELKDVSCKLWKKIMEYKLEEIILKELLEEYDITEDELKKDFDNFIKELYEEGILIH